MIKLYPMINVPENKQGGFTLIEIILTLVIAAVVGAGLVQYLGSSLTKSSVSIQRLRQTLELQQVMENITAGYENDLSQLDALKTSIGSKNTNQDNDYGQYMVMENKFIEFNDTNNEINSSTQTLLKVTIRNDSGDILTTLFSSVE